MSKFLLLLILMLQFGCNYNMSKMPLSFKEELGALNQIPAGTVVSYQFLTTNILGPRCLECHSSSGGNLGGVNLETYESVKGQLGDIESDVANDSMPKNRAKLSSREKEILFNWIQAGGPREGIVTNVPTPTPPQTVEFITYEMVRTQVLAPRCIGCHSSEGGNRGGVNLETYENTALEASKIENSIVNGSMPRPKTRPLTTEQKELILKWIAVGFPEKA